MLRRVRRETRRRPGTLLAFAAAVAGLAALAAAALLGARTAAAVVPLLDQNVHVIAYLDDELSGERAERLARAAAALPGVAQAHLVDGPEALARLRAAAQSLGGPAAVADVEPGFLPRSLEVALTSGADLPARARALAGKLRSLPGIREVDAMGEGIGRLGSWLAIGRRLGLVALVLAGATGLALLALGLMAMARGRGRGSEARVLRQLGETPAAIHLPASLAAAAAALLGAGVGLALVTASFPAVVRALEAAVGLGPLGAQPRLGPSEVAATLVAAVLIGWVGGHAASAARLGRLEARDA